MTAALLQDAPKYDAEVYRPRTVPYEKQLEGLRLGASRRFFGYLMDMGTGKSKVLIDNFCLLHEQRGVDALIIIAEKSVYLNWTRNDPEDPGELAKHLWNGIRETAVIVPWGQGSVGARTRAFARLSDQQTPGVRILVVNIEALSTGIRALTVCESILQHYKSMIALDESILIANPKSNRSKALLHLSQVIGPGGERPYRRILSGMPSGGSPTDVWSQFEFLEPGCLGFRVLRTFQSRYCIMKEIRLRPQSESEIARGKGRTVRIEKGTQNLDELHRNMSKHSFRVRRDECLDLPPKVYERVEVELTPDQVATYAEMRETAMAILKDGRSVTTTIVLSQIEKLHQITCGHIRTDDGHVHYLATKRPAAMIDLLHHVEEQAIIWCGYRAEQGRIVRELEKEFGEGSCARWYGDVSIEERELGERDFQSGRRRFMVASQQSGARGRTWTAATLVIYYSNVHSLELRRQSEDRPHRAGQTRSVTYVDLVSPGTVDDSIIKNLRAGRSISDAIMGDGPAKWI